MATKVMRFNPQVTVQPHSMAADTILTMLENDVLLRLHDARVALRTAMEDMTMDLDVVISGRGQATDGVYATERVLALAQAVHEATAEWTAIRLKRENGLPIDVTIPLALGV